MCTYVNKVVYYRVTSVVVMMLLTVLLSACGVRTVEIDLPDEGFPSVEQIGYAAPSEDFAFYVSSDSVPQSAVDLEHYCVIACIGTANIMEGGRERDLEIVFALNAKEGFWTAGPADAECLEAALEMATTGLDILMVTQRTMDPPSGVVEITFK